jgi:hypothetical protein
MVVPSSCEGGKAVEKINPITIGLLGNQANSSFPLLLGMGEGKCEERPI